MLCEASHNKGKIERPIRYIRGHVWPRLRTVDDLPDLNRQATHWVATVADARVHQTTEGSPASRRPADVAALTAWTANHPCAFGSLRPRRVQLHGTVRADGHAWRVPPEYVGQEVFVQRTRPGGLRVLRGETVLMEHRCPAFPHEVMTGDLPPVQPGPPPQGPTPSRSGRLRLTGTQVERRSLETYAAMVE